ASFVLALEIKLDLDVIGIAQKNLPTGAVWHLVHMVRDPLLGEIPFRCLKAAAAESDMIDDTRVSMLLLLGQRDVVEVQYGRARAFELHCPGTGRGAWPVWGSEHVRIARDRLIRFPIR